MISLTALPLPLILITCFLGGIGLGYAYFRALRATADLFVRGGSVPLGLALTFGRAGFLGVGLYVAVLAGGLALLAALAGVLCAKTLMIRQTDGGRA